MDHKMEVEKLIKLALVYHDIEQERIMNQIIKKGLQKKQKFSLQNPNFYRGINYYFLFLRQSAL